MSRCRECRGRGWGKFTDGCPHDAIPAEMWDFIRQFKHAKYHLPEPGGTNNQCESFLRAWEQFEHLESMCRAFNGQKGDDED